MQVKVYIADDHPRMREGLCSLLAGHEDIAIVGFASTGCQALRDARELRPDVVLMDMDVSLPGGIETTRQLAERYPDSKVIILSTHATIVHYYEAMRAGAWGYLLKEHAAEEVVDAVRSVSAGRVFVSSTLELDR
jgi:two-component system, NarL family, invasion response regulator UvrY